MSFRDGRKLTTLAVVETVRSKQISPHFVRVTVGGEQLDALEHRGRDHWFRLFLPHEDGATSFALPNRLDMMGYLRYLRMPKATRPHLRNYTVREFRPQDRELDIDFVVHGTEGVAGPWALRTEPGDRVALIDQGCGYDAIPGVTAHLLAADESGLPAVAGILRDLPRDATGAAYLEIPHADDAQDTDAPDGVDVHWLVRPHDARPGSVALAEVMAHDLPAGPLSAYVVGEQKLPTTVRRWLTGEKGVPKANVTCQAYWRVAGR